MEEEKKWKHRITAKIFSLKDGFEEIDDIRAINIVDDKYNILVMEDYLPVIGEVHGKVIISRSNEKIEKKDISAFYKCSHNEFEMLIKEQGDVQ